VTVQEKIVLDIDDIGISEKTLMFIIREPIPTTIDIKDSMNILDDRGWKISKKVDTIIESAGEKADFNITVKGDLEVKSGTWGDVYSRGTFECTFEKDTDAWDFNTITCIKK